MNNRMIHILLIEDDKAHIELIRRAFESQAGLVKLIIAHNLQEAHECIVKSIPDLIIADLRLPDGQGSELLPPDMRDSLYPVIIMTSHGDEQVAVEAMKAGALDYVVKSDVTLTEMPRIAERTLREWGHIIERRRAEEALHKLNEQLEQRVEERTIELKAANIALQRSLETLQRTQDQLIQSEKMAALGGLVAGIAHEINTPIGIGVTAASHLEQKSRETDQLYHEDNMKRSDLERYLKIACESSGIILGNLLRAAKQIQSFKQVAVDQTIEEKRTFKLKAYIDEILLSLHPRLKKTTHDITVNCPEELELTSYPGVFSQIIANLVINSLIHGFEHQEQGKIELDMIKNHGTLQIRYCDNGRGMTKEECSRIFEPFYTTKRSRGGSGLGLHIVYNLVTRRLNGLIECESTPGLGTTFIIQIPIEEKKHEEKA